VAFNLFGSNNKKSGTNPVGGMPASAHVPPPATKLSELDFSASPHSGIEVMESAGVGIGVVYEEAAVLYANGNDRDAESMLTTVFDDPKNTVGEGLWMMLLDLFRLTGQKEKFEARVIDYARRFERSPPPWEDLSLQSRKRLGDSVPLINITGALSAQTAQQLQQICSIGRKGGAIRIDLGKLRSADDAGCALFKQALAQLTSDRVRLTVLNATKLATLLNGKIEVGVAKNRDLWILLLEMLKYTGESARFEDLAVDYAVTFEESPPSWESKVPLPSEEAAAAESVERGEEEFSFEGEISGSSGEAIRKLTEFAADRQVVVVDCASLRRMDFVAAGSLFNALATLQARGKVVKLVNVNAMVAALMRVMSIDQVAQVMLRI
jgi:anti-anti-sigma regulatory factor